MSLEFLANIDFTFWLTLATLFSGLLWFVHRLLLRSQTQAQEGWVGYLGSFFPVLLLVLMLRSFLLEPFQIPSTSMLPTLHVGDYILVNKYSYGLRLPVLGTKIFNLGTPQRGDVMVFVPPHEDRYFIKRVIGLPGDHIVYRNQTLYINGESIRLELLESEQNRDHLRHIFLEYFETEAHLVQLDSSGWGKEGEWVVPADHYFTLGDNRNLSQDSRYWGFVPDDQLVGRAVAIWMHKDAGWHWPRFDRNGLII